MGQMYAKLSNNCASFSHCNLEWPLLDSHWMTSDPSKKNCQLSGDRPLRYYYNLTSKWNNTIFTARGSGEYIGVN